jgi:hypothetical protein
MESNHHSPGGLSASRIFFFTLAMCVGVLGAFLVVDAFLPKEKAVGLIFPAAELLLGVMLLLLGRQIGRRNRLTLKTRPERLGKVAAGARSLAPKNGIEKEN